MKIGERGSPRKGLWSVVVSLTSSLFSNAFLKRFTTLFGRLCELLTIFKLVQYSRAGDHLLEAVDRPVDTLIVFYVDSNHGHSVNKG